MHISKITVRNYRLLKDFSVDLEENLSVNHQFNVMPCKT